MKPAVAAIVAVALLIAMMFLVLGGALGANVNISLFGSRLAGWGLSRTTESVPGPTIDVNQNDAVTVSLTSTDGLPHQLLIDYNANSVADAGEPLSPFVSSTASFSFTASVAGAFRYFCTVHTGMYGTWNTASLNVPPTVSALSVSPSPAYVGQSTTFSATASDPDGNLLSYTISWGDGSVPTTGTTPAGGGPISAPHVYLAEGTFAIDLGVDDGNGGQAQQSVQVSVVQPQPMSLSLTSNRREMMSSELATVRAALLSGSTPVTGATLTPSTPLGGTFSLVRELGSGSYEFDWTAPTVTRQTFAPINAVAQASGYQQTNARVVILVDPNKTNPTDPTQLFLLVRAPATSLHAGESMTITVYAYTIEGYVVSGATLTALKVGPGTISAVTDRLNGEYTLMYTTPATVSGPTGVLITFNATKFGYAGATARAAITVLP